MTHEELGKFLARRVFKAGDMPHDKVQRVQMRGGEYPDRETDLGGFCEEALADCLSRGLDEAQQDQR